MIPRKRPPAPAAKRKVLLVDDHPIVREGLAQHINREPDLTVCGDAETSSQALRAVAKLHPDIVVVDLSMPTGHGLELIKDLKALHPDLLLLVFTMHDESLYAERSLRAGARGYVSKQESPEHLLAAIRTVLRGGYAISERTSSACLKTFSKKQPNEALAGTDLLTDRELEIFQLIGKGVSTRKMAEQMGRSTKTIETHRARIMEKLHIHSAAELVCRAASWLANGQ